MRRDEPAVTSAGDDVSIGELRIEGITQGPLRRYGPEGHPGQEEFERVMKTLRRADPDALEPPTPLIATRHNGSEIGDKVEAYDGSEQFIIECEIGKEPNPVVRKRV